ncbi:16471_t:CDS:2 [Entrophospora sp. SA101]|nr:16471_t:CDS:2 [Entrophospora sp. SA101]
MSKAEIRVKTLEELLNKAKEYVVNQGGKEKVSLTAISQSSGTYSGNGSGKLVKTSPGSIVVELQGTDQKKFLLEVDQQPEEVPVGEFSKDNFFSRQHQELYKKVHTEIGKIVDIRSITKPIPSYSSPPIKDNFPPHNFSVSVVARFCSNLQELKNEIKDNKQEATVNGGQVETDPFRLEREVKDYWNNLVGNKETENNNREIKHDQSQVVAKIKELKNKQKTISREIANANNLTRKQELEKEKAVLDKEIEQLEKENFPKKGNKTPYILAAIVIFFILDKGKKILEEIKKCRQGVDYNFSQEENSPKEIYTILSEALKKLCCFYSEYVEENDSSGYTQIVVKNQGLIAELKERKRGDLLKITGIVKRKGNQGEEVEIELEKQQLINASKELPFEIKDEININEDTKYRYRYLDLRRPNSKKLLVVKNQFCHELRNFLHKQGFIDIETPILAQSSPEGANCFIVPANLPNRYYTLPQSAQIFKQLLMVSGFAKYYQIAKSFRNEDARSNRQIEFSQLELEMSFITSQQIKLFIEKLLKTVIKKVFGYHLKTPFPTLTYHEVIKKYKTDKPDLHTKKYEPLRHPFTTPQKKYIELCLNNKIKPEKIISEAFDLICNGEEILSGSIRIHQRELQAKVLEILGYNQEEREKYFGYFLQALEFAAPPHGGIGLGIDRLLAVICQVKNLKELIAFPKNIDGTCSLTGTPDFSK